MHFARETVLLVYLLGLLDTLASHLLHFATDSLILSNHLVTDSGVNRADVR